MSVAPDARPLRRAAVLQELALTNRVFVAVGDALAQRCVRLETVGGAIRGVYLVDVDSAVPSGSLAVGGYLRRGIGLTLRDTVSVQAAAGLPAAELIAFNVSRVKPAGRSSERLDSETQLAPLAADLEGCPVALGVPYVRSLYDMIVTFTATAVTADGDRTATEAMITGGTRFVFESAQPFLQITGAAAMRDVYKHLDVTQLGIGGLDAQFDEIFRGAFASRAAPVEVMRKMKYQHTKGVLLYGPPGTGKTLVARQIGKLLNCVEPKVVNGPEVLNKFVGESEARVRALFADAEDDERRKGDTSPLHVIIFDEIDAICKQRGTVGGGSGVHDSIVNTLLTKIDGVQALNNVLLIGMTNRPDMLDDALLRPGRLELKIEIGLPDERGRLQILQIHTAKMAEHEFLGPDVELPELARQTVNFTGAELASLVRRATAWALDEQLDKEDLSKRAKDFHPVVETRHFRKVLRDELKPAYGAAHEELSALFREGIWDYGPRHARALEVVRGACHVTADVPKRTLLLEGAPGTGKSALAAYVAQDMAFPFVKVVDFACVMGKGEAEVVDLISKAFDDALKSPVSMLVLDDLAKLMSFAVHGPRYRLQVVQTIAYLLNKRPPPGKQTVVIATAGSDVVDALALREAFQVTHALAPLCRRCGSPTTSWTARASASRS